MTQLNFLRPGFIFFKLYSLSLSRKNDTIILKKKEKGAISVNLNLGLIILTDAMKKI